MSEGYTYTMIKSQPDDRIRIDVTICADETARIRICGLDEGKPQLWIAHGDVDVTFMPTLGPVTSTDVQIARDLASKAALYATEVERLHSRQNTQATAGTAA